MHVFAAIYTESMANASGFNLVDVVDNHGFHIAPQPVGEAFIGGVDQVLNFGGPGFKRLFVCGSALADYHPGDYLAGDTLTLTFNFPDPGAVVNAAAAFATVGSTRAVVRQTFLGTGPAVEYGNGDSYPDVSVLADALSWFDDYGDRPVPEHDAMVLAAYAAHPAAAAPFTFAGPALCNVGGSEFTLAVGISAFTQAGAGIDPGAIWSAPAEMLVGNYQFAALAP